MQDEVTQRLTFANSMSADEWEQVRYITLLVMMDVQWFIYYVDVHMLLV